MQILKRTINKILSRMGINTFPKYFNKIEDINMSPVFILGGNRSGTSLISSIISQNPEVEGVFQDNNVPLLSENKHVLAYCTSHHVWKHLAPLSDDWFNQNEGVLWGHPKHISKYYRDAPKSEKELLLLGNALQFYRKTNRIPLVNSHFNMFRIGLITKIFPNAKFILIIRDYQDHMRSCTHKWQKQNINIDFPKIGLHWFTLNSCCIYDLKKYAGGNFFILDYSLLFQHNKKVNEILNKKLQTIGLGKFDYDLSVVDKKHRYLGEEHITHLRYEDFFGCIDPLLSFEKTLTDD